MQQRRQKFTNTPHISQDSLPKKSDSEGSVVPSGLNGCFLGGGGPFIPGEGGLHSWRGHACRYLLSRGKEVAGPWWFHTRWRSHNSLRWGCLINWCWRGQSPTLVDTTWGSSSAGSSSSCHCASSLWGHYLLGWPLNPSDRACCSSRGLGNWNTSWNISANCSANPRASCSSSKRYLSNASIVPSRVMETKFPHRATLDLKLTFLHAGAVSHPLA